MDRVNPAVLYLRGGFNFKKTAIDDMNKWSHSGDIGAAKMVEDGIASGEIEEGKYGLIGLKGKLGSMARDRITEDLTAQSNPRPRRQKNGG